MNQIKHIISQVSLQATRLYPLQRGWVINARPTGPIISCSVPLPLRSGGWSFRLDPAIGLMMEGTCEGTGWEYAGLGLDF